MIHAMPPSTGSDNSRRGIGRASMAPRGSGSTRMSRSPPTAMPTAINIAVAIQCASRGNEGPARRCHHTNSNGITTATSTFRSTHCSGRRWVSQYWRMPCINSAEGGAVAERSGMIQPH